MVMGIELMSAAAGQMSFALINVVLAAVLAAGGIFVTVLFVIVMLKLNKALNIWLEKNR